MNALSITREIKHNQWTISALYALGGMYLDILALREAQESMEEAARLAKEIGSLFVLRIACAFLARTHLAQGQYHRAEWVLDDIRIAHRRWVALHSKPHGALALN